MASTQADTPIVAEIVRNALVSVANEMKIDLMRSSYNPIVYEMLDFSVGVYNEKGEILAQAAGLPEFLCDMPNAINAILADIGGPDALEDGDVWMTNDPYTSTFHLNDVNVIEPVFYEGRLVGFCGSRAHWHDMGGKSPGGSTDSTNVYEEGLMLRSIRLQHKGEIDENVIRMIRYNTRLPNAVVGDVKAQLASCHTGAARLKELIARYGLEVFGRSTEIIIGDGEALARAAVRAIPDGEYYAEGSTDSDGVILDEPLKVAVTVRVKGDEIEFDLTGTGPPALGPSNSNRHVTKSLMQLAFKHLTSPKEIANDGHFRPMTVTVPDGCLFDAQRDKPTLLGFYALELVIDLVRKALAPAIPDRVTAADYGRCAVMHAAGKSPRDGSFIIIADTEGGGWGAKPYADGENALLFGDIRVIPVEVLEHKYPVLLDKYELRQDSGGAGRWRGGLGIVKDYRCTDDIHLLAAYDRSVTPPWGLFGAKEAMHNVVVVTKANGEQESFMKRTGYQLKEGDVMSFRTAGGGGYGPPGDREVERVAADVVEGYVSAEAAARDYGVVVGDDGLVDVEASRSARAAA